MIANKNILEYRQKVKKEIDQLESKLNEIKIKEDKAKSDFNSMKDELSEDQKMQLLRTLFKGLMSEKEEVTTKLKKLKIEVCEKKYANLIMYSDIKPYEVVEERTPNLYLIRAMDATETEESKVRRRESFVVGGFCGHFDNDVQEWNIVPNESYPTFRIRKHKDGYFYNVYGDKYYISDKPVKFYDFNF